MTYTNEQWQEALVAIANGNGGSITTLVDGADATQGVTTDAAVTDPTASATVVALLKGVLTKIEVLTGASKDNVTLLASAAHTTTQTIDNIATPAGARGVILCVDTTANATACSNVVTVQIKDPVSGKYSTILTGAAITGVSTAFYTIYPGATPAANLTVSLPITPTYKVVVTVGNSNSATYSVSAIYLV